MSRIVVLTGSVRKDGNTDLLAKAFAEEAGKHHEVELISASASTCIDSRKEKKGTGISRFPFIVRRITGRRFPCKRPCHPSGRNDRYYPPEG